MADEFDGFPEEGLQFLAELGGRDRSWFDANREIYEANVVAPTKAFVAAMGDELAAVISPQIVAEPKTNGSIAPINNDLRFSPDKSPYKDHLLLRFWQGEPKKLAPTLYVRLSADRVGFATGAVPEDLDRWRELIDDERTGSELVEALAALGKGRDLDVAGEAYKRVPKPYPAGHPRGSLLRHKMLQVRWSEPLPKSVHSHRFVGYCVRRLEACADVHHWFVTNLGQA